jgi:aldose 1-epimerase
MTLSLTAGEHAMPVALGWHPWFRKPDRLEFAPKRMYQRDAEGIATGALIDPPSPPWDDCFLNDQPLVLHRAGQRVRLTSSCDHWVIYDETAHATCIEPQSGPPDAFNLMPAQQLAPGKTLSAWYALEWLP